MRGHLIIFQQAHDLLQAGDVGLVVFDQRLQLLSLLWSNLHISLQNTEYFTYSTPDMRLQLWFRQQVS